MEILGKIRRTHFRDKLSLHEITKRTGLSRNTIRSWLRKPEDGIAPPAYVRHNEPGKLTPFHASLELALKADAHRNKQNRRTAKALFDLKPARFEPQFRSPFTFSQWRTGLLA
jgi:transposase